MRLLIAALFAFTASAQTLGQFRLVDFSARTRVTVTAKDPNNLDFTTDNNLTLDPTNNAVFIYKPWDWTEDEASFSSSLVGNRGRGYFVVTQTDATHFSLSTDMYTGSATGLSSRGVAVGDVVIPLTTYYLRQGPKLWLDGPIPRGAWDSGTTYHAHESVTHGGNTYMQIFRGANLNHSPPNATYWVQVDPALLGPGTISTALRDTSGRASPSSFQYSRLATMLNANWPQPQKSYGFDTTTESGAWPPLAAWKWFADQGSDDQTWFGAALRLATYTEDFGQGSLECKDTGGATYCGRNDTHLDYARLAMRDWMAAIDAIYDTLSPSEKTGVIDRVLNHIDVDNTGIEAPGQGCTKMSPIAGPAGTISATNWIVTGDGTSFTGIADLLPGSTILRGTNINSLTVVGRVLTVDSDTQLTLAGSYVFNTFGAGTTWWYTPPFGHNGTKHCGMVWWLNHHPSSPRTLTGQESAVPGIYGFTSVDDSPINNRTFSATPAYIAAGLRFGHDDLRAVRIGEQAINFHMTQHLAQAGKSRYTGFTGHGTDYHPNRVLWALVYSALILKNSLTVTPPGVLTGEYLKSAMRGHQYSWWLGSPRYIHGWETGYGASGAGSLNSGTWVHYYFPSGVTLANLYPADEWAPIMYDYWRNRRGDYGNISPNNGWGAVYSTSRGFPLFDVTAPTTPITSKPLQQNVSATDMEECISSQLYCRVDAPESVAFSQTGWTASDTQVMIQGQSALPQLVQDNYGSAGAINILQNVPGVPTGCPFPTSCSNASYLLGGNGLGSSGPGWGFTPTGGQFNTNTISIFNSVSGDRWARAGAQYARLDRWGGDTKNGVADNSYAYARVNLTPTLRVASLNYNPALKVQKSNYTSAAGASRIHRHVIHFKSGSGVPNETVVYDDVALTAGNQIRNYWHYQLANLNYTGAIVRDASKITTYDAPTRTVVLTTSVSRLSTQILPVSGANTVAMGRDDYTPPSPTALAITPKAVTLTGSGSAGASWSGGTVTLNSSALAEYGALPVGTTITVTGINTGVTPNGYNGTFTVTGSTSTSVQYAVMSDPGTRLSGGSITLPRAWWDGGTATITGVFLAGQDLTGLSITVAGVTPSGYNGTFTATGSSTNTIRYAIMSDPGAHVSGGTVVRPPWCTYPSTYNPSGTCEGVYSEFGNTTPAADFTGTYRVHGCTSTDGSTCATNATSGELLTILRAAPNTSDTMPTLAQPACTANTGTTCTVLEIQDASYPKVAVFARQGTLITSVSYTTTHSGTADHVIAGVIVGTCKAYRNGVEIASVSSAENDNTFKFSAASGNINAACGPILIISPTALSYAYTLTGTAPASQNVSIDASPGTTLDNFSITDDQGWLSESPTSGAAAGTTAVSVDVTGLTAGTHTGTVSIASTTPLITNSPVPVSVTLTVYVVPDITTITLPNGVKNSAYSQTLTVSGGQPSPVWSLASGTLCTGLSLSSGGVISGTPTVAQTCNFTVRVTDAGGVTDTQPLSITIDNISTRGTSVTGKSGAAGQVVIR